MFWAIVCQVSWRWVLDQHQPIVLCLVLNKRTSNIDSSIIELITWFTNLSTNRLEHRFSNIEQTRMCSILVNRTRTTSNFLGSKKVSIHNPHTNNNHVFFGDRCRLLHLSYCQNYMFLLCCAFAPTMSLFYKKGSKNRVI